MDLATGAHGDDDTVPGIHNALTERNDVVKHLEAGLVLGRDTSSLLQDLANNGEVGLEGTTNSLGDVTEALKDGRLELVAEDSATQVVEQAVHELVAVRLNLLLETTADVADKTDGNRAESGLFLVVEGTEKEGDESLHVLVKVGVEDVGQSANGTENSVGDGALARKRLEERQQELHNAVGLGCDFPLETLDDRDDDRGERSLDLLQGKAVLDGDNLLLHGNGLLETSTLR